MASASFHFHLLVVLSALHGRWARPAASACSWYPSADYQDVSMECTGAQLTGPPLLLPATLQSLQLSGTGIRTLSSATFRGRRVPRLSSLSVTGGVLTSVEPLALCALADLTVLDLYNNSLEILHAASFKCNRQLYRLDLSGNPNLRRLPALVSDSIVTLYAEHCGLADVGPSTLRGLTKLRLLYLDGNVGLDCFSVKKRLLQAFSSLTVICGEDSLVINDSNNQEVHVNKLLMMDLMERSTQTIHGTIHETIHLGNELSPMNYPSDPETKLLPKRKTELGHASTEITSQSHVEGEVRTVEAESVLRKQTPVMTTSHRPPGTASVQIIRKQIFPANKSRTLTELDYIFTICMTGLGLLIIVLAVLIRLLKSSMSQTHTRD